MIFAFKRFAGIANSGFHLGFTIGFFDAICFQMVCWSNEVCSVLGVQACVFAMSVSLRWIGGTQRWHLQWNSSGKKTLYITSAALNGSKETAERVALRLKTYVENGNRLREIEDLLRIRDEYSTEELSNDDASDIGSEDDHPRALAVVASDAAAPSSWGICEPLVPSPAMPPSPAAAAVRMKATLKVFVEQTAAGHKFWECSVRSGMFNRVRAGDLLILTQTQSKGMVVAVGEIANGPIHRESRREALYSRMPPHLRRSVEEYLGTATAFDYVQFSQVFDVRRNRMNFKDLLAKGLFEDPGLPWCNGLLTAKATSASSMVGLRDFLATHGVVRACQDGVDVE